MRALPYPHELFSTSSADFLAYDLEVLRLANGPRGNDDYQEHWESSFTRFHVYLYFFPNHLQLIWKCFPAGRESHSNPNVPPEDLAEERNDGAQDLEHHDLLRAI